MGINRDRLRNVILVILVLLSFLLSYELWTAGRNIGEEEESTTGQITRTNASTISHKESDVFRPTKVALHNYEAAGQILVSPTYPLKDLWAQQYEATNFNQLIRSEVMPFEQYANQVQAGDWVEFIYHEELPIGILEQKFNEIARETANSFYNRMLVNRNDDSQVYFYHTEEEMLYGVSVLEEQSLNIEPFLNQENLPYIETFPVTLEGNLVYLPVDPVTMPYRSYVIDQLPDPVYINSFFPDTSLVDVRSSGNLTRYIDLTKEVSINENTDTLNYLRQIADSGEMAPTTRFERSFDQVNRFENWTETFILANYNRDNQSISFRREIDGFPVFSTFDFESISVISLVESGVTQLKLPLEFIQTPISIPDSDEAEADEELISGSELLAQIESSAGADIYEQIEDITIGYTWVESDENTQVVNFQPEWYLSIDGTWASYPEVLDMYEEGS